MKVNKVKALLLYYILATSYVSGQYKDLKFTHLTTQMGLSNSESRMIVQDKEGFIWIGTADGLNCYDGLRFKVYRKIINDSTSLQDNSITALFVDFQGVLWIGTNRGGLSKYIKEKDNFITYTRNPKNLTSINDNSISGFAEDTNNQLWIATFSGLNLYDQKKNNFIQYQENPNITIYEEGLQKLEKNKLPRDLLNNLKSKTGQTLSIDKLLEYLRKSINIDTISKYIETIKSNSKITLNDRSIAQVDIRTINTDNKGNILLGYSNSIISIFNPNSGIFEHFAFNVQNRKKVSYLPVTSICPDGEKIWISTFGDGVWIFDIESKKWSKYNQLTEEFVSIIKKDSDGILWIGGREDGVVLYDRNFDLIKQYKHDESDKYSLSTNSILNVYEDRQKNIWICEKQGAVDFTIKRLPFDSFNNNILNSEGLTYSNVTAVLEEKENILWVGFYNGGIDIIDRKTNKSRFINSVKNSKSDLSEGTVHCLFKDGKSNIWIGTYLGGLQMYDKKNNRFITYMHDPLDNKSISGNDIRKISEDREGNLWIALHGDGVEKFETKTKEFKHYRVDYLNLQITICSDWVYTVYCDLNDNIWVGTNYGLSCIDKKSAYIKSYYQEPGNDKSLSNNIVYSIFQDSEGKMWFGTSEGLNLFDPKNETFRVFTRKDGLPNDNITGILEDNNNNLWLGTFKGLSRLSLKDFSTTNFDVLNGLETDEFLIPGVYKSKKGEIFLGGRQGLISFFPDSIKFNTFKPPVYLTDFKLFNKSVPIRISPNEEGFCLDKHISYTKDITLSYHQNVFTFEFIALNFLIPDRNQYAYMMEGFDDQWNDINFKHDVTFTNLPSGNYIFRVKASNNDGVWNETGTSIRIKIRPPWWRTYLAYTLYTLIIGLLLLWFRHSILQREKLRRNIEYERMEAKKQHELDLMKLRFFTNISHEFRTPLTLILAPIEKLIHSASEDWQDIQHKLIYRNANRLLRLINQLMDIRKLETGGLKLEVSQNDIVRFVNEIANSFNFEAQERKIAFKIISDEESLQVLFDPDKLDKILYNLIANAFKFTPDGGIINIHIQVKKDESVNKSVVSKYVEITVEDTGIGIAPESLTKIFERFYQADTSYKNQGTGIGLSLTKELVELHQGKIHVTSEPSKGTQFSVLLPLGKEHIENYQLSEKNAKPFYTTDLHEIENVTNDDNPDNDKETDEIISGKLPILLIIEDNPDLRLFIKHEFKQQFRVIEAKDGVAGYEKAIERIPDLVISDIMMPKMEGFELCKKLKTDERTCHIPVIMLTAFSSEEKIVAGLETGADDYMAKPFSTSVLKARVKNLIESRQLLRKQFAKYVDISASAIMPTELDQSFLQRVFQIIEKHISDTDYDAYRLANELLVSRSQLYRKIQALTGFSVHELIRNIRLKRAAELLETKNYNVTETAGEVGFNDITYFIRCFSKNYGVTPSKYRVSQKTT